MTTPRYANQACAAKFQERGEASSPYAGSPDGDAWIVNFGNGNSNNYHRDNNAFVRAVRAVSPGECLGAKDGAEVELRDLYAAWKCARRKKRPSAEQLRFEQHWSHSLIDLQARLNAGTWEPSPTTCFVAQRPKAREIHAPAFSDRVVHHWLVPQLERIYEPSFIHDSYSNRRGKGSHAAVRRLQQFVRQVQDGQGPAWYLQLDIHNFFNCVHRPTLYAMLRKRLAKHAVPEPALRALHALLRRPPTEQGVMHRSTEAQRALVPAHKRLDNAAPGCGLPIGNLSSQFFANVYLDALDQFIKHRLKAKRYLRYVDDFVIVHHDPAQLRAWQADIERFLADTLRLRLKDDVRLRHVADGVDFLGYVVRTYHTTVRQRVVQHAREALQAWSMKHVSRKHLHGTPAELRQAEALWRSYQGHFRHARTHRLQLDFHRRFPWLRCAAETKRRFSHRLEHPAIRIAR